jgi:hypothetical protein
MDDVLDIVGCWVANKKDCLKALTYRKLVLTPYCTHPHKERTLCHTSCSTPHTKETAT